MTRSVRSRHAGHSRHKRVTATCRPTVRHVVGRLHSVTMVMSDAPTPKRTSVHVTSPMQTQRDAVHVMAHMRHKETPSTSRHRRHKETGVHRQHAGLRAATSRGRTPRLPSMSDPRHKKRRRPRHNAACDTKTPVMSRTGLTTQRDATEFALRETTTDYTHTATRAPPHCQKHNDTQVKLCRGRRAAMSSSVSARR